MECVRIFRRWRSEVERVLGVSRSNFCIIVGIIVKLNLPDKSHGRVLFVELFSAPWSRYPLLDANHLSGTVYFPQ